MSFTETFGGNTIYPAEPEYLALALTANTTLEWPLEQATTANVLAKIIDVTPSGGGLSITLPDATKGSTGYAVTFYNAGASTFAVKDAAGGAVVTVASGEAWNIYLRDNSTLAGAWRTFQMGAGTSTANAAALAGAGLVAITTTLNEEMEVSAKSVNYAIVNGDRAKTIVWTGGLGALTLPDPATVGANWFVVVKNDGLGSVTITPTAGTIDGSANLVMGVNESTFLVSTGTDYVTIGFGQTNNSVFDFISIDVSGNGNFTLTGAQLNRISYKFTGVLTGARNIIVPASIQQYWIDNSTTGAFTLTVKASGGDPGTIVQQGTRSILYCDGTNVVAAETINNLTFADGTAGAPSVTFTSNPTQGLYKAATDTLGFSTAGLSRGTVDAEGNWVFNAPNSGTDPTLSLAGASGTVGILSITSAFNMPSTAPGIIVKSTLAGGDALVSIVGGNGVVGTDDFALYQDGSTSAFVHYRPTGVGNSMRFMVGADEIFTLSKAGSGCVALGNGGFSNAIALKTLTQTTVGAAGGGAALPATPNGYLTVTVNGGAAKIPYYNP